jgi:hypothetical protein
LHLALLLQVRQCWAYSLAQLAQRKPRLVWRAAEWKLTGFHQLVRDPAQIKQLHDVVPIDDGTFLSGMKTSLNGLQFGFGLPKEQIKAVGGLRGPAHMLNYDDHIWT